MKKFFAMVLALVVLVSVSVPAFALSAANFKDIPSSQWYYKAVDYCVQHGLMSGVGNGVFSPNGVVTRSQVTQVLYNREGSPKVDVSTGKFSDVGEKQWFAKSVTWCADQKIVTGVGGDKFDPNNKVTRGDLCLMLYRYCKNYKGMTCNLYSEEEMNAKFVDWDIVSWDKEALRWATKSGLISGTGTDKATGKTILNPRGYANRAQLAQYLTNLNTKVFSNSSDDPTPPVITTCIHGNNPDTCPICHPAPSSGIYDPNPPSANFVTSKVFAQEYYDYFLDIYRNKFSNEAWRDEWTDTRGDAYSNYDMAAIPEVGGPAVSRSGWIPKGGYTDGSSHTVDLGSGNYLEIADSGTIYNQYDVDVTSVDGLPSELETEAFDYLASSVTGHEPFSSIEQKFRLDQYTQMVAEAANREAIENIDNLVHAGFSLADVPAALKNTSFEEGIINGSPEVSRRLLEISKTASSKAEAKAILEKEQKIGQLVSAWNGALYKNTWGEQNYSRTVGYLFSLDNQYNGGEYYFKAFDGKVMRSFCDIRTQSIRFDHTPDAVEIYQAIGYMEYVMDIMVNDNYSRHIGIAFDEDTNTLTACCLALNLNEAPDRLHATNSSNYLYYSYR